MPLVLVVWMKTIDCGGLLLRFLMLIGFIGLDRIVRVFIKLLGGILGKRTFCLRMGMLDRRRLGGCFFLRWRIGHGLIMTIGNIGMMGTCLRLPVGNLLRLGMNWWIFDFFFHWLVLSLFKPISLKQASQVCFERALLVLFRHLCFRLFLSVSMLAILAFAHSRQG